ncbi:hypothetical protein BD779DRAFT_1553599 [Infundibulicybe gibba]|nr:hypothetical protein BD779DRAFT_1553599 [Infundibulicybe gibba]
MCSRIQTNPPLPIRKTLSTISKLRNAFCGIFLPLQDISIKARDIIPLPDCPELLDDSPLNVLGDGDLISIKMASSMRLRIAIK